MIVAFHQLTGSESKDVDVVDAGALPRLCYSALLRSAARCRVLVQAEKRLLSSCHRLLGADLVPAVACRLRVIRDLRATLSLLLIPILEEACHSAAAELQLL